MKGLIIIVLLIGTVSLLSRVGLEGVIYTKENTGSFGVFSHTRWLVVGAGLSFGDETFGIYGDLGILNRINRRFSVVTGGELILVTEGQTHEFLEIKPAISVQGVMHISRFLCVLGGPQLQFSKRKPAWGIKFGFGVF